MNKPNSYEEVRTGGDYTPVELGGHYAVIKQVAERMSKTNKPMIVVLIDFEAKDKQANYFSDSFKNDTRENKKWSNQATQYILTEDSAGKCNKSFKSFITSVERSNPGFTISWGENFTKQFANKKVGVVFGNVEEEYNGEVKMRRKIRWFCEYDKAGNQNVPADKLLPVKPVNDFINVPDVDAEEIPFD